MKLSYNQLNKLRSGQTVWRVWGTVINGEPGQGEENRTLKLPFTDKYGDVYLYMYMERVVILGKKQNYWISRASGDGKFRLGTRMILPKRLEASEYGNDFRYARFLSDMHGTAAFTKQHQAERFIAEILDGLHPEIVQKKVESYFDDQRWEDLRCEDDWNDFNEYDGAPEGTSISEEKA